MTAATALVAAVFIYEFRHAFPYRYRYRVEDDASTLAKRSAQAEIAFLETQISNDPQSAFTRRDLAGAYLRQARVSRDRVWYAKAQRQAEASLKLLPQFNHGAELLLGEIAQERHDFDRAIAIAQNVRRENPGDTGALVLLIKAQLAKGDAPDAAVAADDLVRRAPSLTSYTWKALTDEQTLHDDQALLNFKRALAVEDIGDYEGSAWTRSMLGRFYARHGDSHMARQLYQEALRIKPRYVTALALLANLELAQHHGQKASDRYAEAFALSGNPKFLSGEAQALRLLKEQTLASELDRKAEILLRQQMSEEGFGHRVDLAELLLARNTPEALAEARDLCQAELQSRHDPRTREVCARH